MGRGSWRPRTREVAPPPRPRFVTSKKAMKTLAIIVLYCNLIRFNDETRPN